MSDQTDTENLDTEEAEAPTKLFINNVDLYQSFAIAKVLAKEKLPSGNYAYSLSGTIKEPAIADMTSIQDFVRDIVSNVKGFMQDITTFANIIILDIGSLTENELHESRQILMNVINWAKAKKAADPIDPSLDEDRQKIVILISTPLVWALTSPSRKLTKTADEGEEEGDVTPEEADDIQDSFDEVHYRKRRPHPKYAKHKCFEREVILMQNQYKPFLKTVVICPGITYGGPNDIFQCYFKLPFYDKDIIPIFYPGNQTVPMLYIDDFANIIKDVVKKFPPKKTRYIFAAQPQPIFLRQFALNLAQAIAGDFHRVKIVQKEDIFTTDNELFSQRVYDTLTLDLKFNLGYLESYPFLKNGEISLKMCQELGVDFRAGRNLFPLKIVVDGPPYSGKTCLSEKIAAYYQLNYINPMTIINDTIKYLKLKILEAKMFLDLPEVKGVTEEEEEEEEGEENYSYEIELVRNKIEDWTLELNEAIEYKKISNGDDFKKNFDYIKRLFIRVLSLNTNQKNQGYVMDGCPFTYEEANAIFFNSDNLPNDTEGAAEEIEEGDGFEDINKVCNLCPTHLIILDGSDELLCARAKNVCEEYAELSGGTEEKMIQRLEEYRERNQEDTSISSLFYDNDIIPITICITEATGNDEIFETAKRDIGAAFLYPLTKLEKEKMDLEFAEHQRLLEEDAEEKRLQLIHKLRNEREQKLQQWTKDYERLKAEEDSLYEAKTMPLREYLTKFVMPTLTEGILKVAETKPKDPVDFLAEYLFECNPNGHVLSQKYDEKKVAKLLKRGNAEITKSLDALAENTRQMECSFDFDSRKKLEANDTTDSSKTDKKKIVQKPARKK